MSFPDLVPDALSSLNAAGMLFALVLARVVPIIEITPFLGGVATPRSVKTAAAFALALLVYPTVLTPAFLAQPPSGPEFALLVVGEGLVGMTLGFVIALLFESVRIAGQAIDAMRGQTMANALVPQLPERASVTADYLYQLAIALFFLIGGHRLFVAALVQSYDMHTPLGYFTDRIAGSVDVSDLLIRATADAITLGISLAMPVIVAILLADLVLAMVNKAAPQVNVFFLGMPLKALLGVAVVMLGLGLFADQFAREAIDAIGRVEQTVDMLGGVNGR